ncbi:hypothetical protein [Blastomonas aquatica]|uniref:Uncharacterized protein n=1 Tax=Blastomonas aquatica TaxID=1510276 RepID=A0ABQ1JQA6_9SPHN|nr:hypothetical protein [Blastomonas aquatica]GGB71925.1 hypothetical protein GCM10010833_28910 [Blastomonas aquatica]
MSRWFRATLIVLALALAASMFPSAEAKSDYDVCKIKRFMAQAGGPHSPDTRSTRRANRDIE